MKISNPSINQTYVNPSINQGYAGPAARVRQEKSPVEHDSLETRMDRIHLSERTRDLQRIRQAMETQEPGRAEHFREIKNQVQANQYTIDAEQIAEKMIGSIMNKLT